MVSALTWNVNVHAVFDRLLLNNAVWTLTLPERRHPGQKGPLKARSARGTHGKRMGITLRMSDQACEIMPGRRLLRQCAKRPKSTPNTVMTITCLTPW